MCTHQVLEQHMFGSSAVRTGAVLLSFTFCCCSNLFCSFVVVVSVFYFLFSIFYFLFSAAKPRDVLALVPAQTTAGSVPDLFVTHLSNRVMLLTSRVCYEQGTVCCAVV